MFPLSKHGYVNKYANKDLRYEGKDTTKRSVGIAMALHAYVQSSLILNTKPKLNKQIKAILDNWKTKELIV